MDPRPDADLPELPSRYEPLALLGRGGMGAVYLVRDRDDGVERALKIASPAPGVDAAEAYALFRREHWALTAFAHPSLIAAHDMGTLPDGRPYFTMDPVAGHDLAEAVPVDEATVRAFLPGLLAALGALHGRGYLHGDLSLENVRLVAGGGVKLMDLGLLGPSGQASEAVRGSPATMAPEVIRQAVLDPRTDLYALGAVLYHALAGRPPFGARDRLGLLRAHLEAEPEPLAAVAPGVSPALADAVMRLLAKDPAARPPSARALLEGLGLAGEVTEGGGLLGSPLVGRAEELQPVAEAIAARAPLHAGLGGPEGAGKTRCLAELRALALLHDVPTTVVRGEGVDAPPYRALRPLFALLTDERDEAFAAAAPVLARVMPLAGVEPAPALEGQPERVRLHVAVADVARVRRPGPWLLQVDDADRLDPASRALLDALVAMGPRWIVVEAAQDELSCPVQVPLAPLAEPEVATLAGHLLGQADVPPPALEHLALVADGRPGLVEALLAHWIRAGALVRRAGRWEAAQGAEGRSPFALPAGLAVVHEARFAALGAQARTLAGLAAVLGARGDMALLAEVAAGPETAFFEAFAELEAAGVCRAQDGRYAFARPAQAEALAGAVAAADAARVHDRAAAWLARQVTDDQLDAAPLELVLALARHGLAGSTPRGAVPWAIAAARRALAVNAGAAARPLLEQALACVAADAPEREVLAGQLVHVWRFQGQLDTALALLEDLLPRLAPGTARRLEHEVTLAAMRQLKGDYGLARPLLEAAVAEADRLGEVREGLRARMYLARVAFFLGDQDAATAVGDEGLARARGALAAGDINARYWLAYLASFHGYMLASAGGGRVEEGLGLLTEAVRHNEALGNMIASAEALNNQGNALLDAGRAAEAREVYAALLALCERIGPSNETVFAHLGAGTAAMDLADVAAAGDHAGRALALARGLGRKFPEAYAQGLGGLASVYGGDVAVGLAAIEAGLALARAIQNRYCELLVLAFQAEAWIAAGRWPEAEAGIAAARELAEATGHRAVLPKLAKLADLIAALPPALRGTWRGPRADAGDADGATRSVPAGRIRQLARLLPVLASSTDVFDVLNQAVGALVELAGAERGMVALYDGYRPTHRVTHGLAPGEDETFSSTLVHQVLWRGEPQFVEDVAASAELAEQASVQALALRSAMALPLVQAGEVIGVMVADSRGLGTWSEADLDLADALAQATAQAITAARARMEAAREVAALEHLQAFYRAMLRDGTGPEAAALGVGLRLTGAAHGFVLALADGVAHARTTLAADGSAATATGTPVSTGICDWVLAHGEPLHLVDVQDDEAFAERRSVMALGLRTVFAAPLPGHPGLLLYFDSQRVLDAPPGTLATLARLAEALGEALGA